jgi:hypothetical protein
VGGARRARKRVSRGRGTDWGGVIECVCGPLVWIERDLPEWRMGGGQ